MYVCIYLFVCVLSCECPVAQERVEVSRQPLFHQVSALDRRQVVRLGSDCPY